MDHFSPDLGLFLFRLQHFGSLALTFTEEQRKKHQVHCEEQHCRGEVCAMRAANTLCKIFLNVRLYINSLMYVFINSALLWHQLSRKQLKYVKKSTSNHSSDMSSLALFLPYFQLSSPWQCFSGCQFWG